MLRGFSSRDRGLFKRSRDIFDNLRKIRNGINYYGRKVAEGEAEQITSQLKGLIEKFQAGK